MKKTSLTLIALFAALQFSHAQWFNGTDIYNTNSGKVGIGTTTPSALLQIGTTGSGTLTNTSPQLIVAKPSSIGDNAGAYSYLSEHQQTANSNYNRLQTTLFRRIAGSSWTGLEYRLQFAVDNSFTDGSKAFIAIGGSDPGTSGGGFISLATAGTDRLSVTNSGNVGIGTTSPSAKLTVYQSDLLGSSAKNATLLSTQSGNAGSYNVIQSNKWLVRNSSGSTWFSARIHDAISVDGSFSTPQTNTKTWWERDPYNNVQSWGNSADTYMTINAGKVGIGTTIPAASLHITGAEYIPGTSGSAQNSNLRIGASSTNLVLDAGVGTAGNPIPYSWLQSRDQTTYAANYDLALNPNGGNVGIGTIITKGYKLAVNGAAIATSMKVQVYSEWSDFVFKKDYKLPTLSEVKAYIDKNQHLPEIPSAAEVHANGIDLGEMNNLLLRKVEELTLYLIEKETQLKDQQHQLKTQDERLKKLEDLILKSEK